MNTTQGIPDAKTWEEHGSPRYAIWYGYEHLNDRGVGTMFGSFCTLTPELIDRMGWVRIDFPGGQTVQLSGNTKIRVQRAVVVVTGRAAPDPRIASRKRLAFGPVKSFTDVVSALVGYYDRYELKKLHEQVGKQRRRLDRKGKGQVARLMQGIEKALEEAYERNAPKPYAGMIRLYPTLDSNEPVEVELLDGTRATDIPADAPFSLVSGGGPGQYFVECDTGVRAPIFMDQPADLSWSSEQLGDELASYGSELRDQS